MEPPRTPQHATPPLDLDATREVVPRNARCGVVVRCVVVIDDGPFPGAGFAGASRDSVGLRSRFRHGGGILGDGSWPGRGRRIRRADLRGRTVRLGARHCPDSMKCEDEKRAQRQRADRGCKPENHNSRHVRRRLCRLDTQDSSANFNQEAFGAHKRSRAFLGAISAQSIRVPSSSASSHFTAGGSSASMAGAAAIGMTGGATNCPAVCPASSSSTADEASVSAASVAPMASSPPTSSRRRKVLNYADLQRRLEIIRNHRPVLAKKIVDERDLARVQQGKRELSKVAEGPKQINALPEGGFNGNQSLLRLEQQEARFKLVQKHKSPPRHRMQLA